MDLKPTNGSMPADYNASQVADAASRLYVESKKMATCVYSDGKHRLHDAQDSFNSYSEQLAARVREKPLSSLLLAALAGYVFHALWHD